MQIRRGGSWGGQRGGGLGPTVLIAEADAALLDVLNYLMRRAGYATVPAADGIVTMQLWKEHDPELLLLDTDLPSLSGWDICGWIRCKSETPIILLSAANEEEDVVRGLELGADAHVTLPFKPPLLVARVRAVLRWQLGDRPQPPGEEALSMRQCEQLQDVLVQLSSRASQRVR
jgi:DNA-binding response OmpR family regulator